MSTTRLRTTLVAALAVHVASCHPEAPRAKAAAPAPAPVAVVDPAAAAELDAFFRARFPADAPGIAVMIAKRGQPVWQGAYGLADVQTREPITTRTAFNLGSLSKTFVANAILILAQRGRVSLDDPMLKYFPDFAHPDVVRGIQLRHLLTHTSGLPDRRGEVASWESYMEARDVESWAPEKGATELAFPPGTDYAYSNPAYNGLALVIEQVTGGRWQSFVEREVLQPAGMVSSTITDGPEPSRGVAHAYVREEGQWNEYDYGEYPTFAASGNGGVWSSVEDLVHYERALGAGTFLPTAVVTDSRTVKTFDGWTGKAPPKIGWSWFIADVDGHREVGHTGGQGGFLTNYFVVPEKELQVVYLMNNGDDDGWTAVNAELHRWLEAQAWLDDAHAPAGRLAGATAVPLAE